jgi:putative Mg2+ transporter-C (MgtC) family protein
MEKNSMAACRTDDETMIDVAFTDLDWNEFARSGLRLLAAITLGAAIGWERERRHRWAGLRTHMLVTLAAAAFTILGIEMAVGSDGDPTRVVQGIATGIGFLGAGTILKMPERRRIEGLTTASGIWTAAAVGVAVGAGRLLLAVVLSLLTVVVLQASRLLERSEGDREP